MGAVAPIMSVLPVLSTVNTALQAVNRNMNLFDTITGRSDRKKLNQIEERMRLQQQSALQNAMAQQSLAAEQSAQDEAERRDALRRAVARQRASFGAQGVSSGGSSDAVLLGIFEESEEQRKKRERLDALRSQVDQTRLEGQNSMNLLEATQAAQKINLQRYYL